MDTNTLIQQICVWAIPVLFAITVHEAAHGWMARRCGDSTAFMLGRLTLNPIKHIDPMGTVIVPMLMLTLGGFMFGWAKPVPVNPRHFKNPRWDGAWVAAAGPLANFLMMFFWAGVSLLGEYLRLEGISLGVPMRLMGTAGIQINIILALLNLLPIPPLDGSRVFSSLLPVQLSWRYNQLEPFGFFIIIGLLATNLLGQILGPPFFFIFLKVHALFNLAPMML